MSGLQSFVHALEEGRWRYLMLVAPLVIGIGVAVAVFDFSYFHGLTDAESMDNAQLARQIARGDGFTTEFIRPYALAQLDAHATAASAPLFHIQEFPHGTARLLPDTYNAPAYPSLLAVWFKLLRPDFDESAQTSAARGLYAGDRPIPWLNQIFLILTAGLVFIFGWRLFDERVAWVALLAFLLSNIVWQYSLTALATSLLMFLVTGMLFACMEIFFVGERREEDPGAPSWPAWLWTLALALMLGVACLARLQLLALLLPLGVFLALAPRRHLLYIPVIVLIAAAMVAPWFWHEYNISGDILGSNGPLFHYGIDPYAGNQAYRAFQPMSHEGLLGDAMDKEWLGFDWNLSHAWTLLGTSPLVILFVVSLLHGFRRRRAQALRLLVLGAAVCLVAAGNLGDPAPAAVGAWNVLVLLYPAMLVAGAAYFFVLLDRMELDARVLQRSICVALLVLTSLPLRQAIKSGGQAVYPPYVPSYLRYLGNAVKPEQWITSDMPWANAWYGDHVSLWLPDSEKDFEKINDELCPSQLLLITPVTYQEPVENLVKGEDKDWLPLVVGATAPDGFPLPKRAKIPNLDYVLWLGE
jgi:hypothetical protein